MDADHLQRFAGIGRLYGRAGMERLARKSFLVVGLGGVGSWTIEALARSGLGALTLIEIVPCGGKTPRNFALSPDGTWLVCAHQGSDTVSTFRVDPASGKLTLLPGTSSGAQSVCVLFAP